MSKELANFDQLKADITIFVAPALKIAVTDFTTSEAAIEAGKTIKKYSSELEKKRKELVGPLNDQVKLINSYAKGIEEPLAKAEHHIKAQLSRFAEQQEIIRQQKMREAEAARLEAERKAEEERRRIEDELEEKRQAEFDKLEVEQEHANRAVSMFGGEAPAVDIEAEAAKIDERLERERAEAQARMDRERVTRAAEASQAKYDANQFQLKGARKAWECELIDINQVPKEFLIITLNKQAVLAAARAGVKIPGVRTWQEMGISLGHNTRVTKMALASEEDSA